MKNTNQKPIDEPTPVEQWTVMQVASHLGLTYQIARNNMLAGDYGAPNYDAETRRLTVSADRVRSAKSKRGRPAKKRRR